MRAASPALKSHLAGEVTHLATCWKLVCTNGKTLCFTDHTSNLTFEGQLYQATSGFSPTTIETTEAFNVDSLDIAGILDSEAITEIDILAGLYDFAEITIFVVNARNLSQGKIIQRRGWLGEVTLQNGQFIAEVRGLAQKLSQNIGELYSPTCRTSLGDHRCKVDLANYKASGTVGTVISRSAFSCAAMTQSAGYFSGGEIAWLSGANTGQRMEIKEFASTQFILALSMGSPIQIGDKFEAIAGCDKTLSTCISRFNNGINFRGEPYVPGMDAMLTTAATRF